MNRRALSKQVHEELAKLRSMLGQTGQGEKEETQRAMFTPTDHPQEDENMLSIVISDALHGIRIPSRYPGYFRKLQADAALRAAFFEALELLEKSYQDELEALPQPPDQDLSFLLGAPASPIIERSDAGNWRITWTQLVAHLDNILFPPVLLAEAIFRDEINMLEETPIRLLQSEVELEGVSLNALLEATQPLEEPGILLLSLSLALGEEVDETTYLPHLTAQVLWGEYNQTARVDITGQANFPRLSLDAILTPGKNRVRASLLLTIEAQN